MDWGGLAWMAKGKRKEPPPPVAVEKDVVFGNAPCALTANLCRWVLTRWRAGTSEDGVELLLDIWRRLPEGAELDVQNGNEQGAELDEQNGNEQNGNEGGATSGAVSSSPPEASPVVLWIHGGGWKHGNKSHIPACMLPVIEQGLVVASVGYRKSTVACER